MTGSVNRPGASSTSPTWNVIDWQTAEKHVLRLQMRIAKATREEKHGKAKALQWILTHSYSAKLLAVKRDRPNQAVLRISCKGDLNGLSAKRFCHSRGVSSCTRLAGC